MKIYRKPLQELYSGRSFFNFAAAQYTFDFSQCPAGDPGNFNQIFTILDNHTYETEACAHDILANGTVLSTFKCVQTGDTQYTSTVIGNKPGQLLTCESGEEDVVFIISVNPGLPSTCTLTDLVAVANNNAQLC